MNTQHTPTPWGMSQVADCSEFNIYGGNDGMPLATVLSETGNVRGCRGSVETRANAAFIVRACNAHDELVAACLRVLRSTHFSIDREHNRGPEAMDIRNQLEAALAKAGAL